MKQKTKRDLKKLLWITTIANIVIAFDMYGTPPGAWALVLMFPFVIILFLLYLPEKQKQKESEWTRSTFGCLVSKKWLTLPRKYRAAHLISIEAGEVFGPFSLAEELKLAIYQDRMGEV